MVATEDPRELGCDVTEGVDITEIELVGVWMVVGDGVLVDTALVKTWVVGVDLVSVGSVVVFLRCSLFRFQYSCNDT